MKVLQICFIVGILMAGASACAGPPYVLDADEFNRSSAEFGKGPTDISSVVVCYSSSNASPDQVRALAVAACGEFGKSARYVDQDYLSCPILTPVSANFDCDGPEESTGTAIDPYSTYYYQN